MTFGGASKCESGFLFGNVNFDIMPVCCVCKIRESKNLETMLRGISQSFMCQMAPYLVVGQRLRCIHKQERSQSLFFLQSEVDFRINFCCEAVGIEALRTTEVCPSIVPSSDWF